MLQTLELNIKNRKIKKNGLSPGLIKEDCYLNTSMRVMLLHRQQCVPLPRPVVRFGLLQHMLSSLHVLLVCIIWSKSS
jgi:hypothetical protein